MEQIQPSSDFSVRPDEEVVRGLSDRLRREDFYNDNYAKQIYSVLGDIHPIILLRSMPLLQCLPEDKLKNISEALQPLQFGPGKPIVRRNCEGAAGLYIIWDGEAKVISPPQPSDSILGHKESFLSRGDYFGIRGPLSLIYKVDVVAINKVLCLVVPKENINLLRVASVWDWDLEDERPSTIEKILTLHTVESVGDVKLESPGFPNYFSPYLNGTKRPLPKIKIRVTNNWFGGQLVAQALLAATKSVDPEQLVHSLHSYFIKTADIHFNVVFNVERIRDGRSYSTRHVKAIQNGNLVFFLLASFKKVEESDFEHTIPMPSVPRPEECVSIEQRLEDHLWDPRLPLSDKKQFAGPKFPLVPIETRYVNPDDKFQMLKREPRQQVWMRSRTEISSQDQNFHRCILAYASDLSLLETSKLPHPETIGAQMEILSLDHSMWFHRPFNAHQWLLFSMESPTIADQRGLNFGRFYTQDGKLVISVAQEGVVRFDNKRTRIRRVAKL